MRNLKFLFWILLAVSVSLTACSKDEDDDNDDIENGDDNGNGEVATSADTVAVANRVAFFRFNGNADDEDGNTTVGNGVQYTTDRHGRANSAYRGTSTANIIIPDADDLRLSSMTFSMWLRAQQMSGGTGFILSFIDPEIDWNAGYALWQEGSARGDTLRYKAVTRHQDTDYFSWTDSNDPNLSEVYFPPSSWFHLVFVYDGENSVKQIYLDGERVSSDTLIVEGTPAGAVTLPEGASNFYIGRNPNTDHEWLGNYQGYLDDLRIFSVPLTEEQVGLIYDAEKPEQ